MSYAAISTRNFIGAKALPPPTLSGWKRYLSGQIVPMRGLGDLDMNDQAVIDALNAGVDQGTLSTLVAEGASDGQLEALANGQLDLPTLMAQLTGNLPAAGSASGTASMFPAVSGLTDAQQAQVNQAITQTGMDPTDESSWFDVTGQLQQINTQLKSLLQQMQASPAVAKAIGPQVTALQQQYSSTASQWTGAYTAVFGEAPTGLNGLGALGIAPLAVVAVIGVFVAVVIAIYEINKALTTAQMNAQAAATTAGASATQAAANTTVAANQATLVQEYQAAIAAGNSAQASNILQALNAMNQVPLTATAAPVLNLTSWFTSNWEWLALGTIVVMLGPSLIKKL